MGKRKKIVCPLEEPIDFIREEDPPAYRERCRILRECDLVVPISAHTAGVLERETGIRAAVKEYEVHFVLKITADNCLLDPNLIDEMIEIHRSGSYDYTCVKNLSYVAGEVINAEALWKASRLTREAYAREPVTPYIRDNPDLFKVKVLPEDFLGTPAGARLTIDTPNDFEVIKKIYALFYPRDDIVDRKRVYGYLRENHENRF